MLFVATNTHPAAQCPLNTDQGKMTIKQTFSEAKMQKAGVKLQGAYVSCPKGGLDHKGFFIFEANSAIDVTNFFGPMTGEVREVVPFSEVAKTLG
ncbi:MAG: hypothetical protein ACQCN5_13210 [Candidatus Bathyarchaeia archaeon]